MACGKTFGNGSAGSARRTVTVVRSPRGLGTTNCAFGGAGNRTLFITESDTGAILKAEFPEEMNISGASMFAHAS
ncbi:hypothetical protein [uncultured Cohaesibacter sp.]|uniref:hypothetical protein n=1 Tax=uncultured Cohaesibacter sp. TaxID=1002546 RepID=UPI0037479722